MIAPRNQHVCVGAWEGSSSSDVGIYYEWEKAMFKFEMGRRLLRRFKRDESANVAFMFAFSAIAVIGCMGAAMDFSTLSNAKARSQSIADQTALAAAIFVKTNGREPVPPQQVGEGEVPNPEEGYLDSSYKTYKASDLGYEFKGWVEGGAENVDVSVDYDGVKKEATVTVRGKTVPTFMQILGRQNMVFSAVSTAKYEQLAFYDPASVLMILDNSGSMAFDDKPKVPRLNSSVLDDQDGAQPRIAALQSHAGRFITKLQNLVGNQSNDSDKVLRTGMMAYNHTTIAARTVPMDWQTTNTKNSIDLMVAQGGTNSAPPIDTARTWMSTEDEKHVAMHGDDPLKFLIFMTDGINSDGSIYWLAEEGTGQWRGQIRYCWYWWCWYETDTVESVDEPVVPNSINWEEGRYDSNDNIMTHADCTAMKNDGVKIYTIGFALAEGWYDTNFYAGSIQDDYINEDVRDKAYSFLSRCASEPSTFLTAENADQLEQAFERIGNDIQTEIVRLSN